MKIKQYKIDILNLFVNEMKNYKKTKEIEEKKEKDELMQKYKFKIVIENMNFKLKKYIYMCILEMLCKYLYLKASNPTHTLFLPKLPITSEINDNIIENEVKLINKEKILRLKNLINNKIKEQKNILHKAFIKFYYQGLLYNNINSNTNDNINPINNQLDINNKLDKSELVVLFNENDFKTRKLQNIINNKIRNDNERLKLLFYKFFYKGIISSIYKNPKKQKDKNNISNGIYVKKGYEKKKSFNKNKK